MYHAESPSIILTTHLTTRFSVAPNLQICVKFYNGHFMKIRQEIQIWLKSRKIVGHLKEHLITFCC